MNKSEYEAAKRALQDAVRRGDLETVWAIRRLIITFYEGNINA